MALFVISCQFNKPSTDRIKNFNASKLIPKIKELSKQWTIGLATKDMNIFRELYDKNAHYLPNEDVAIHGNENIALYWQAAFGFVSELKLNLQTLDGNEDILFETGVGTVKVMNESGNKYVQNFKYVNVWKKQNDGGYKVVIDTFNKGSL